MGVGHIAVGLALKKAEPGLNAGLLIFAAYASDFLLGVFVLLGMEAFFVPPDYAQIHYLRFQFPYSHGLAATLLWTAGAGALALLLPRNVHRLRIALLVGAAVFSHFLLDVAVHVPEIPLAGADSLKLGLGLWNHLGIELFLETAMAVVATAIYLRSTTGQGFAGRYGMLLLMTLLTAIMVGGQATATQVPGATAMAMSWIAQGIVIFAVFSWLDGKRAPLLLQQARQTRIPGPADR